MDIDEKTIGQEARRLGISRKEAIRQAVLKGVKDPELKDPELKGLQALSDVSKETGISIPVLYYNVLNKKIKSAKFRAGRSFRLYIPDSEVLRIKEGLKALETVAHKDYLTPLEVARELGMNRVHLYQHLLGGRIEGERHGLGFGRKQWFISREALEEFKRKMDVRGLVSMNEASLILGISVQQIRRLIRKERLELIRPEFRKNRFVSPETVKILQAIIKKQKDRLKGFIHIKEAAHRLGVTRQALYIHFSNGHLKGLRSDTGGKRSRVYISREALKDFAERIRKDDRNHLIFEKVPNAVPVREACRIIGCPTSYLYGALNRGLIQAERVPGMPGSRGWVVIKKEKIAEFLKKYGKRLKARQCPFCRASIHGAFRKGWKFCPFCGKGLEKK